MGTKHPEIFAALAAPFEPEQVMQRSENGRTMKYITARTARNRLDDVLGPENWSDEPIPYMDGTGSFLCKITITLPDGTKVTKSGVGGGKARGNKQGPSEPKDSECLPLNAEALTRSGWKEYHQLSIGQEILAYDMESGICRWTPIRHITVFDEPCPIVQMQSKSFRMLCTSNHRWVVDRRDKGVMIKKTSELDSRDAIVNAARAEGGSHPLSPREAAILGWLSTDGTVYRGRDKRGYSEFHALITQTKEPYRSEIRKLVGRDAVEQVRPASERQFPGHAVASEVREQSRFRLRTEFARALLCKAGIEEWSDLITLAPSLTSDARAAMVRAMLDADGQHSCSGQVVFGKKSKPGVMAAFEILATLEGISLGIPRLSTTGDVPLRTLRKQNHVWAKAVTLSPGRPIPVWCPTTDFGTWVTRWNGIITITGNSDAFKRASEKFGIARYLYRDGVPKFVQEAVGTEETRPQKGGGGGYSQSHRQPSDEGRRQVNETFSTAQQRRPESKWGGARPDQGHAPAGGSDQGFDDRPPTTGRALYAWLKRQDDARPGLNLVRSVNNWAKENDLGGKMVEWDDGEIPGAFAAAQYFLEQAETVTHEG